ncbi:hypothetical protein HRI_005172500 [Hibiscus trionum]|uniref:Uncharacterized protein n=1 Tax=Hibiscus trionum TaxID=183268 RepID=A0A9W7JI17_HIBTR|nr:hypothetical protein HRI_005172500 [Hibiscus trionum]
MIISSSFKFVFIFSTIILSAVNLSSCRYTHTSVRTEVEGKTTAESFLTWQQHFPAARSPVSRPSYEASYRTVPGGPNPLHN